MAWYKTGVITLTKNSDVVTASGTEFNTYVVPGFGLVINENEIYEVLSVDSNTQLTLAKPYAGTTKTNHTNWAIYQTQGIIPDLVAATNALHTDYGAVKAEFNAIKDAPQVALTHSESAIQAAQEATLAAQQALASQQAAALSAEDAEAITGIEASITPTPHKTPIADANGYISINWFLKINDIGVPGELGFGVGICPFNAKGYSQMHGTLDRGSPNYGNYVFTDGSIEVWNPAGWYRIGHPDNPTYAEYGVNSIHIVPFHTYKDRDQAAVDGFALHRAFIDGGEIKPGFFFDKYSCSNNNGVASSLPLGKPMSTNSGHNPISNLNGSPANNLGGTIDAAKTRSPNHFTSSIFMFSWLAMVSEAHGQASTSSVNCAWYSSGATNFPKGNNVNNGYRDTNDSSVTFTPSDYSGGSPALTGSGSPFAKTTHNGQDCGIADLNGNMNRVAIGMTCVARTLPIDNIELTNPVKVTSAAHGLSADDVVYLNSLSTSTTQLHERTFAITVIDADTFTLNGVDGAGMTAYTSGGSIRAGRVYATRENWKMSDYTSGNTLTTDHWGAAGVANTMLEVSNPFPNVYPNNTMTRRIGNGANQVFAPNTQGNDWVKTGLGLPTVDGTSPSGTNQFGADYFYYPYPNNEMAVLACGSWSSTANSGVWNRYFSYSRGTSGASVTLSAASYGERL